MQPDDSVESVKAIESLIPYTDSNFDRSMNGARLQSVTSVCRLYIDSDRHHHSFIGELGAGRRGIAQKKAMLWG